MDDTQSEIQRKKKEISDKLKSAFSFTYDSFSEPIQWIDDVGLSRVKEYGNQHASIYKFGIVKREFDKETSRKQLWVSAGYGKKLPEGISYGTATQNISDPIDVDFPDEFFFDLTNEKFYRGSKEINAEDILSIVENAHIKPTKIIKGFYLRCKVLVWRKLFPQTIESLDSIFVLIRKLITGKKTKTNFMRRSALILLNKKDEIEKEKNDVENIVIQKTKPLLFFGYEASRGAVIIDCTGHLLVYVLYQTLDWNWPIIKTLLENNFLLACYAILSLAIINDAIPYLIESYIYKYAPKMYIAASQKRLKI